jgi:hypothetical protein
MANDPLFGKSWQMNPEMTSWSTEFAPQEETRVYEEIPNGYKLTVSGVHNGEEYSWHYSAEYDGQPHPVHGRDDVDQSLFTRSTN